MNAKRKGTRLTETKLQPVVDIFRLHRLKGDLKDFWSVTVRANWRVIFPLEEGDAYDVDLIDYH